MPNNVEFTWEEIAKHDKQGDAWVVLQGGVYNVSKFLNDHPGGIPIVMEHLGTDIGDVWSDEAYHIHSASARNILHQYRIGVVKGECRSEAEKMRCSTKAPSANSMFPTDIDWDKPIMFQVGTLGTNYNDFIHDPKVLDEPARFFESDFIEIFSRTPWYVVPIVWVPVVLGLVSHSITMGLSFKEVVTGWALGVVFWTLLEYALHRFVFHLDEWVQFSYWSITLHFLFHGNHHKLPQDHMRLVFPPVPASFIVVLVWRVFRFFYDDAKSHVVTAGSISGYMCYDLCHYYLHHSGVPPLAYFGRLKKYHLAHHYENHKLGYGISSKFWDIVLGTELDTKPIKTE